MKLTRACALKGSPVFLAAFAFGLRGFAQAPTCPDASSHISMESGSYSSQPGVTFVLHHFVATLEPMGKTLPNCLQKITDVTHADIFVSNESLTQVFAKKLRATDSSIRDLKIVHGFGTATLSGEMVKLVPIKFSIEGTVSTDGTSLSMTADKIDADGIPIKMLLGMVGQHLSSVLGFKGLNGVQVNGNVMSFSPERVAHLRGYIASVEATPQGLTLHYGRRPGAHTRTEAKLNRPASAPS